MNINAIIQAQAGCSCEHPGIVSEEAKREYANPEGYRRRSFIQRIIDFKEYLLFRIRA